LAFAKKTAGTAANLNITNVEGRHLLVAIGRPIPKDEQGGSIEEILLDGSGPRLRTVDRDD
jgi:hypothetical protein